MTAQRPSIRLQDKWLDTLLPHVADMGWTDQAVTLSAREAGLSSEETALAAPNGVSDLLERFFDRAEEDMQAALEAQNLSALRTHEKVAAGIRAWLGALEPHRESLERLFDRVAALGHVGVHRIHGDLHLGQTLRTSLGWKIVDFEGEPAKPLAERLLPDCPWRDVAGMLRSFDYAPRVVERTWAEDDPDGADVRAAKAQEWANRAKNHFLVAYAGGDISPEQRTLVEAYVADKAVYETVYETRNRPTWVEIPLQAVAEIGAA